MCAVLQGEFIETHWLNGYRYGMTMAALEQVAQQGLACVTHMSIEVRKQLHNTYMYFAYVRTYTYTICM